MIIGRILVDHDGGAVHTHRDSYLLDNLSVVSVRRPLLPVGAMLGLGLAGFAIGFGDLLYLHELLVIAGAAGLALAFGIQAGQLKLLSRDLRGSELAGVVWGQYRHLNHIRRDIAVALRSGGR